MKKIFIRLTIIVFILLVAGFLFSIVNAFFGNPLSAAIATSKIRNYVEKTYPEMDLEVPKATYNFKFEEYFSVVKSKTSMDTWFSVGWSGGRINDSYEYSVEKRETTYQRLQQELSKNIEEIIKNEFPYETTILFADFGKEYGNFGSLTLDMPLDMENPPLPITLTVYLLTKDVTYENLRDRLLELSEIMKSHGIPISTYDLVLQEPMPEGEKPSKDGKSLYLYNFPANKLSEPDLITVMKEHQKEWEKENNKN